MTLVLENGVWKIDPVVQADEEGDDRGGEAEAPPAAEGGDEPAGNETGRVDAAGLTLVDATSAFYGAVVTRNCETIAQLTTTFFWATLGGSYGHPAEEPEICAALTAGRPAICCVASSTPPRRGCDTSPGQARRSPSTARSARTSRRLLPES